MFPDPVRACSKGAASAHLPAHLVLAQPARHFDGMLRSGDSTWMLAARSLPAVAVYGLTIDSNAGVLYAATHGRGAWKLDLSK